MKLIVGLGNPGSKYAFTYHNLGFMVVDSLSNRLGGSWQKFSASSSICNLTTQDALLLKPLTFMNNSGQSVNEIISYFKIELEDIWVIHDELDLPLGEMRLSFDSSSAGHRGVQNIIDTLGSQAFWRWRLGINMSSVDIPAENYVLTVITENNKDAIFSCIQKTTDLLIWALMKGIDEAKAKSREK